jgi:outer membrane protein
MKNFSNLLNVVLLAAVAVLYYLHFSARQELSATLPAVALKGANIVFVNSDSLLDQYDFFKNKKAEFDGQQEKVQSALKAESDQLKKEVTEYQQKAATMTDQQRQQTEEKLGMKQQQIMKKKDEMVSMLDDEQAKTNDELHAKLVAFMKEYNKKKNYSFILGYQKGGGILFANDSLDITKEIITGLNKAYEKEGK